MKCLLLVIFCFPMLAKSQAGAEENGIRFEKGLDWQGILSKAKQENKYVFVDCSASWCVPCKKMEKNVFPLRKVGKYMNDNFISVHVQMDTSGNDDAFIKSWYQVAHNLRKEYDVTAFPTYLFFSADGRIVHRYLFAMSDSLFLKVAENALDTTKQYYTLLNKYLVGQKIGERLAYIANISKLIGNDSMANQIAADYLHNYLNGFDESHFFQEKNIDFISKFTGLITSTDRAFSLIYKYPGKADELIDAKGFSKNLVCAIVTKEEIDSKLWPNKVAVSKPPSWDQLDRAIVKKYDKDVAELVVVNAQIRWYTVKKDRPQLIKYSVKKIDKYGLDTAGIGWALFNNLAYDLFFKYCNNKDTLNKVIGWMEIINASHQDDQINMDTYANLLYKVGRKREAIQWQVKAAELEDKAAQRENRDPDKAYKENLDKMKSGIPTWVVK